MNTHKIAVIAGDGIGPEVIRANLPKFLKSLPEASGKALFSAPESPPLFKALPQPP